MEELKVQESFLIILKCESDIWDMKWFHKLESLVMDETAPNSLYLTSG